MALDTLTNVKSRLGISDSINDTFLTAQINLISDTIEAYCRRKFASASYTQTFYRDDCYNLMKQLSLFCYPVSAVASIVEDTVTLDPQQYRLNKPTGIIVRTDGDWFFRAKTTIVSYTAGDNNIPLPVLSVLDALVNERYSKKIAGVNLSFGSDVQRISIPGGISIDFDYTLQNNERSSAFGLILGSHVNILDSYRSERAVVGSGKLVYVEGS